MKYKINSFNINKDLMYMIQKISKESSEEILVYFWEIANTLVKDFYDNSKAYRMQKSAKIFFKENECLPIKISVSGPDVQYYKDVTYPVAVTVQSSSVNVKILPEEIQKLYAEHLEKSMQLRNDIEMTKFGNIPAPKKSIPRFLKGVL